MRKTKYMSKDCGKPICLECSKKVCVESIESLDKSLVLSLAQNKFLFVLFSFFTLMSLKYKQKILRKTYLKDWRTSKY